MPTLPRDRRAPALHLGASVVLLTTVAVTAAVSTSIPHAAIFAGAIATGAVILASLNRRLAAPPLGLVLTLLLYVGLGVSAVGGEQAYPAAGLSFSIVLVLNLTLIVIAGPSKLIDDAQNTTRNMRAFRLRRTTNIHLGMLMVTVGTVCVLAYLFETHTSAAGLIGGAVFGLMMSQWISAGTATLGLMNHRAIDGFSVILMEPARAAFSAITGPYVLENTKALSSPKTRIEQS